MAVLKQTSPTAWPVAPKPEPSSTVPSASTSSAVGLGSSQSAFGCGCVGIGKSLNHAHNESNLGVSRRSLRDRQTPCHLREALAVLRDDINSALKEAMKAGEARRVSTLRLVKAAILEPETRLAERATLVDAEI